MQTVLLDTNPIVCKTTIINEKQIKNVPIIKEKNTFSLDLDLIIKNNKTNITKNINIVKIL